VKRSRQRHIAIFGLLALTLVATACGTAQRAPEKNDADTVTPTITSAMTIETPAWSPQASTDPAGTVDEPTTTAKAVETLVYPTLMELDPAQLAPGQEVTVVGTGGYVKLGEQGYNESAREFALYIDGRALDSMTCYVGMCTATVTVPADVAPGTYQISTEGGSTIELVVVAAMEQ
jgi:hypothetical protein